MTTALLAGSNLLSLHDVELSSVEWHPPNNRRAWAYTGHDRDQ